jgi:cytochrome bd ubiquinol oxidase subunit I
VVCANAWMNSPTGFEWVQGEAINIDPWAAMFNPAALSQGIHMTIAAFQATGFAVAGVHALGLLRQGGVSAYTKEFHKKALHIALAVGALAALIQPISGDLLAKAVALRQPAKLAAMEALFKTSKPASLLIGGLPDEESQTVRFGFHVPKLLSFLAHGDFDAEVKGLDQIPRGEWPPVLPVHLGFQIMIACGMFLGLVGIFSIAGLVKYKWILDRRSFLKTLVSAAPLGFLAIEAGWVVTEVGRQPWIIYHIMKTSEAVTPMPGLVYPMMLFLGVYILLSFLVIWLMVRQFRHVD